MAKLKNDQKILYGTVAVVAVFAVYLYLPQDTPPTHRTTVIHTSSDSSSAEVDPADDPNVHFPPYKAGDRDPFIPGVSLNNGQNGTSGDLGPAGKWQLTGIDTVNGVTSALVENSSTQESESLKVGDSWNGLKVVSIGDDVVNLVNSLGLPVQVGFAAPPSPTNPLNPGQNLNVPSVNQLSPLPPLSPGSGTQPSPAFFENGGGQ